jgi:hypothetical protein
VPELQLQEGVDANHESPRITMSDPNGETTCPTGSESTSARNRESRRGSDSSEVSEEGVNWEELEKTEEQEPRDEGSDDVGQDHCLLWAPSNLAVHGLTTCPTRTGEQSPCYQSQIRPRQNHGRSKGKKPISTSIYTALEEACQWSYTCFSSLLSHPGSSHDRPRILRRACTRLYTNCSMFTYVVIEEGKERHPATPTRCCMAEYVWCKRPAVGRSIRSVMRRVKSIRGYNWEGSGEEFSWCRDVPRPRRRRPTHAGASLEML